jgi:hypothetical protein
MKPAVRTFVLLVAALSIGACGVRLGGGTREYDVIAFRAPEGATPADAAGRIAAGQAQIAFLTADRDSAWFAAVAEAAGLALSGPARTGPVSLAFLTNLEIVGDTSLVLTVPGGGSVHMQDALYRVDDDRFIDLMAVRFDAPDLRAAVRRLFDYISSDVSATVPVLLAVDGPTPQAADSAAVLMRAYYGSAADCAGAPAQATPVRLLYGPSALITCRNARVLPGDPPAPAVRVMLTR